MMTEEVKQVADVSAAAIGAMTFLDWISPVAGIFTIVWLALRIWETETVQKLVEKCHKQS